MNPWEVMGYAFMILMTVLCSLALCVAIFCFIVLVVQPLLERSSKKDDDGT